MMEEITIELRKKLARKLRDAMYWKQSHTLAGNLPVAIASEALILEVLIALDDELDLEHC